MQLHFLNLWEQVLQEVSIQQVSLVLKLSDQEQVLKLEDWVLETL
jgi:hypothetical protein